MRLFKPRQQPSVNQAHDILEAATRLALGHHVHGFVISIVHEPGNSTGERVFKKQGPDFRVALAEVLSGLLSRTDTREDVRAAIEMALAEADGKGGM